jgi:hypothetical protein
MPFRPSRGRRGPDRFLDLKMILLGAGGLLAVAGFALRFDWLVIGAIVVLAVGFGLGTFGRSRADAESHVGNDSPDED